MIFPIKIKNVSALPRLFWHPSVLYIEEGFGGHQWWMAQTPFSPREMLPYTDRYELPCIHYSDDGVNWETIDANPIDDLTDADIEAHNYLSDPHLVYKDGIIECYYRKTILFEKQLQGSTTLLFRKISKNGREWSEAEIIADLSKKSDVDVWGNQIISQSLIWKDKTYYCWYVDASHYIDNRGVRFTISKDGHVWKKFSQCKLIGSNKTPWHIDVQYYDGKYQMLSYTMEDGSVEYYTSEDGVVFVYVKTILTANRSWWSFWRAGLYRSCSVKYKDRVRVYFSAYSGMYSYIGCMETDDFNFWTPIQSYHNARYIIDMIMMFPYKCIRKIKKLLRQHI